MNWHRSVRRAVALVTSCSFFTACYTQRPLSMAVPTPATRIVAQVTDTGAVAMGNTIGSGALEVEGVVAEADASTWKLHLVRVDQRGGTSTLWNRELVTFPRYALTNARERKLDTKRSWIVAGIIAAAIVTVTVLFGSVLGGEDTDTDPPPPV
jgi:hypothetical protein